MSTQSTVTLIRTKLYRPRVTDELVPLLRVRQTLDYQIDRPLTLVCAPAGFGKTTLLSDWLANCHWPSAWLSLDEQDNDLAIFVAYLIAALRTLFPNACAATATLLQAAELPPLPILSATLINDIDSLADSGELREGQRFLLVLDDYYLIQNLDVHQVLNDLLLHPPRSLHLVIGTRHDPPLSLASQRARGRLAEIRMAALRFNSDETAAFMRQAVHSPLDQHTIDVLAKRADGWVAALRFAALALNMQDDDQPVTETLLDNRFVMEYLLSEVLTRLPAGTQEFLLRTAILNRLTGSLCDAITGQGASSWNGQRHLQWLEQENIFTVALDDQRQWYRYHHLLHKLLQDQLARQYSTQEIAELHSKASTWYASNGYVEEAITHALVAGDEDTAAQLVGTHRHALMNHEQWQSLERWLLLLPRRLIDTQVDLLMAEAWLLQSRWRIAETLALLERVETLMQQAPLTQPHHTYLQSEVDTLRSHVAFHHAELESQLAYARRALDHLPLAYSSVRGHAWMDYAVAQYLLGDTQNWRGTIHAALNEDKLHGNAFPTRVLQAHCFLTWMAADLGELQQGATYLVKLAAERQLALGENWGHYFLGCAAYQADNLDTAEREFGAVAGRRYLAHGFTYLQASFGLATVLLARGRNEQAQALTNAVLAYAWERGDQDIMDEAKAFQAYVAWRLGRKAEARRWAAGYDRNQPLIPLIMFHAAPLTLAKILLSQGTNQSLAAAEAWLQQLHHFVSATHNTRYMIEICALQALLYSMRRQETAALECTERAVLLAETGGLVRVFIDLGTQMAALLSKVAARGAAVDFIAQILGRQQTERGFTLRRQPDTPPIQNRLAGGNAGLYTPLSRRELEVLELLAQRLTVKEVAERLVISELTAKRHTANIYQKLGVNRRRDAVAIAQAGGLLA